MKSSSPGAAIAVRPTNVGAPPEIPRSGWAERRAPIRVVLANDHLGYADGVIHGPARWFRNVLPLFDPARVEAKLLILGKDHPFAAELRRAGVSLHFLNRSKWDPRALIDLVRFLRTHDVDVLHIMGMKGVMLGPLAARATGCRVIANLRDAKPLNPLLRSLTSAAVRRADLVLACSTGVVEFATRHFALSAEESIVLRHAIPVEEFAAPRPGAREAVRRQFGLDRDVKLIGAIGRLVPIKGHDYLIRAIAKLGQRRSDIRLLIVGDGERASELRRLAQDLGLARTVFFAGHRDDVAEILAALDLLAMPSLNEGLGHVSLEAVASGTPVVGFDAPGTNEAVVHDQTGLLVPTGDVDALADALEHVLGNPVLYDRLVAGCHAYRKHISIEPYVRDLEDLYLATLRGWRPSPTPLPLQSDPSFG